MSYTLEIKTNSIFKLPVQYQVTFIPDETAKQGIAVAENNPAIARSGITK